MQGRAIPNAQVNAIRGAAGPKCLRLAILIQIALSDVVTVDCQDRRSQNGDHGSQLLNGILRRHIIVGDGGIEILGNRAGLLRNTFNGGLREIDGRHGRDQGDDRSGREIAVMDGDTGPGICADANTDSRRVAGRGRGHAGSGRRGPCAMAALAASAYGQGGE